MYTGSGNLTYSGSAVVTIGFTLTASGEFIYSGSAECTYEIAGVDYEYVGSGQFIFSGTAFRFREIITFLSHITKEIALGSKIVTEVIFNSGITKEIALNSKIHLEKD